jgi:cytoskeletal protein CcmA (bactofilin family)
MAFGKKQEIETEKPSPVTPSAVPHAKATVVGRTLFIEGEINSDEEVFIEGKIAGNINVNNRVIVGKNGEVNADIQAREVVIKGKVNGNVKGQNKVEVVPDGVLNGNIVSHRVVLAEGAMFKGNIDMTLRDEKIPATQVFG